MKRRGLLTFLGAAPLLSRPARAQRAMPVVGFMTPVSPDTCAFNAAAFREGLAEAAVCRFESRPSFLLLADEVIR